jgi:NAD(P)-dependent dehydrogenase (short-subunit alcohol dehydrogenase family)
MAAIQYTAASPPAYAAAKAGVVQLSFYAASAHAADRIRVNSVLPGLTLTPNIKSMFDAEEQARIAGELQATARCVMPEEIAASVLFLSSDEAGMITGRGLEVNGGRRH